MRVRVCVSVSVCVRACVCVCVCGICQKARRAHTDKHTHARTYTHTQARGAVKAAKDAWGAASLALLEAEDRLSVACEKGATGDKVTLALRAAYQVRVCVGGVSSPNARARRAWQAARPPGRSARAGGRNA